MLDRILIEKKEYLVRQKMVVPLAELEQQVRHLTPPRPFAQRLRRLRAEGKYGLICELKRTRPRGRAPERIREDYAPSDLARAYELGGASCLSVLTDTPFFEGKDEHLRQAREACSLPVLRKDFLFEPYQIVESRVLGADAVLLILSVLKDRQVIDLAELAINLGMDVLLEVHDEADLKRVLHLPVTDYPEVMIGINNRNLKTLEIDPTVSERLAPLIPSASERLASSLIDSEYLAISASGLSNSAELEHLAQYGISCFLVGSSLMKQTDLVKATQALLEPVSKFSGSDGHSASPMPRASTV